MTSQGGRAVAVIVNQIPEKIISHQIEKRILTHHIREGFYHENRMRYKKELTAPTITQDTLSLESPHWFSPVCVVSSGIESI